MNQIFAPVVRQRRSPASVGCSALLHCAVAFGGIWVADVGAFERPRPRPASITFLTIASTLPDIAVPLERAPIEASVPVVARTDVTPASAPLPEPPAAAPEPIPAPIDTRPIEVATWPAARESEPAPANVVPPPAAAPAPQISIGAFDRTAGSRTSANAQPALAVSATGLQSARAATVAPRPAGEDVRAGAFDAKAASPRAAVAAPKPEPVEVPVEIVFKPTPDYTDQAKAHRIQGDVVLDVEFSASGTIRVLRVVAGLGYGLDEAATRAASRIHFKPAQSGGRAVDVRTTVHIVFRLS
jgi:TonB family protein